MVLEGNNNKGTDENYLGWWKYLNIDVVLIIKSLTSILKMDSFLKRTYFVAYKLLF